MHDALPAGARIGWHEVEGVLGQGGFGITYLAIDKILNRRVAIKEFFPVDLALRAGDGSVVPAGIGNEAVFASRLNAFLTEARTLARFTHPSIVRVLSVFEARGTAYIVMAYERGKCLKRIYSGSNAISERELRAIVIRLAEGLQELHRVGFVHRDIKPENIYVRDDGSPILLDFGSARRTAGPGPSSATLMITPGYSPFEQFASPADGLPQGPWTDIYALGATLYLGVCGRKPIDAERRADALRRGEADPLKPAAHHAKPGYSKHFLKAIDSALAFNPGDRPQCITDWCELLAGNTPSRHDVNRNRRSWRPRRSGEDAHGASGGRRAAAMRLLAGAAGASLTVLAAFSGPGIELHASSTPAAAHSGIGRPDPGPVHSPAAEPHAPPKIADDVAAAARASAHSLLAASLAVSRAASAHRVAGTAQRAVFSPHAAVAVNTRSTPSARVRAVESPAPASRSTQTGGPAAERTHARAVQQLLAQAEADLKAFRLTSPAGQNALHRFEQVLALDPANVTARRGRSRIVGRYLELAEGVRARGRYGKARVYLSRANVLEPDSPRVMEAQRRLASAAEGRRTPALPRVAAVEPVLSLPRTRPVARPTPPRTAHHQPTPPRAAHQQPTRGCPIVLAKLKRG